jgi:Cu(I)/Ag(I) efflux system membrane fusion protein
MIMKSLAVAGMVAGAVAAGWLALFGPKTPEAADSSGMTWQAVQAEVPVGQGVRLEVKLVGADDAVVEDVTVTQTRLDMGPDGMPTMTAPLMPVAASMPGVLAFEADLAMAGRWALTLTGMVDSRAEPVTGTVIFTAVEQKAEAALAAEPAGERKILYYRNPMGLPDISPVPKKDWMGMDYIPVYADEANDPPGTVRISLDKVQRAGVRTEPVIRRDLTRTVRAVGRIEADESRLAVVTAKFGGFVEELFVPVTGAEVRAGEPLLRVWIESPEILQKQADYLLALRGTTGGAAEVARVERNLRLFGLPEQVIEGLRRTREPVRSVVLTAPQNGTVIQKPALVGMRFAPGDMLFKTADLSTVWVMAQVAERDLAPIQAGQAARIALPAYPDGDCDGRVAFIYPELDPTTRTALVRIEHPNPDRGLKLGLYADVAIETRADDATVVAIPESAVIDSGTRRVAFVAKGEGVFEPRDLVTGRRGDGFVEVQKGIAEGERIVVAGNFLIDAESNLRAALASFTAPDATP